MFAWVFWRLLKPQGPTIIVSERCRFCNRFLYKVWVGFTKSWMFIKPSSTPCSEFLKRRKMVEKVRETVLNQTQKVFFHKYLNFMVKTFSPFFHPPNHLLLTQTSSSPAYFSAHFFSQLEALISCYPTHVSGKHSQKKCNNNNLLLRSRKKEMEKTNSLKK